MAYYATICFNTADGEVVRRVRIQASSFLHAATSSEQICLGYSAGSGRTARVIDMRILAKVDRSALETEADFISFHGELK